MLQFVRLRKHLFSKWVLCGTRSKYKSAQSKRVPPHEFWGTFSMLVSWPLSIIWRWQKFCCNYFDFKPQDDWTTDKFQHFRCNALVIGFPEGGDPGLMWGNTGTLWVLCNKFLPLWWGKCGDLDFALLSGRTWGLVRFCSTERRLGTVDCSLDRWQDSPDRFKTESGEFRTGRKVEIFTRLRAAKVVFKKKNIESSIFIRMQGRSVRKIVQRTRIKFWSASSNPVGCLSRQILETLQEKNPPRVGKYKNFEMHN